MNNKKENLIKELEQLNVDVIELEYIDTNIFAFKIATPINTYLDEGTAEQIIEQCKKDVESSKNAKCKFCGSKVNYNDRNSAGIIECKCGAIIGSIPKNLAKYVIEKVKSLYGMNGIYTILENWSKYYWYDSESQYNWFSLGKNFKVEIPKVNLFSKKIIRKGKIQIPVFVDSEGYQDANILCEKFKSGNCNLKSNDYILPDCSYCKHALSIDDNSNYSYSVEYPVCVYPYIGDEYKKLFNFEFCLHLENEHYIELDENIIQNAFLLELLDNFLNVDRQTRELEGLIYPNFFHGPICPYFSLDEEHLLMLEDFKQVGTVPITFGIANFEALEKEKEEKRKKKIIGLFYDKLKKLFECKKYENIFSTRIEKRNINSTKAKELIEFLSVHFELEELEIVYENIDQEISIASFFNLSNNARPVIFKRAIEFKKS